MIKKKKLDAKEIEEVNGGDVVKWRKIFEEGQTNYFVCDDNGNFFCGAKTEKDAKEIAKKQGFSDTVYNSIEEYSNYLESKKNQSKV